MSLGFIVGDTVEVDLNGVIISGTVTRISNNPEDTEEMVVEIQRPGGSHIEFSRDDENTFDFITKTE